MNAFKLLTIDISDNKYFLAKYRKIEVYNNMINLYDINSFSIDCIIYPVPNNFITTIYDILIQDSREYSSSLTTMPLKYDNCIYNMAAYRKIECTEKDIRLHGISPLIMDKIRPQSSHIFFDDITKLLFSREYLKNGIKCTISTDITMTELLCRNIIYNIMNYEFPIIYENILLFRNNFGAEDLIYFSTDKEALNLHEHIRSALSNPEYLQFWNQKTQ